MAAKGVERLAETMDMAATGLSAARNASQAASRGDITTTPTHMGAVAAGKVGNQPS